MIPLRLLALGASLALAAPVLAQETAPEAPAEAAVAPEDLLPLTEEVRATSVEALQATLYDLNALQHDAHQEHWNVVGIEFYQLHDFYGHLYQDLDPHIDTAAERIRALGAPADGRPSAIAANALPTEPEPDERDAVTTLENLATDWKAVSDAVYQRIDAVEEDLATQDLLIDVVRTLDLQLWMLRAHLTEG